MIRCPSCGNENKDGEAFCAFCAAILQAPPPAASTGAPPPRAPAAGAVTPPPPPPPPGQQAPQESGDQPGDSLDPLDQFLVKEAERKNGPSDFQVEELGSFASNFDNLEDQLEDAHRAAALKARMNALHKSEQQAGVVGGDKLDQLDAILDMELQKAQEAAIDLAAGKKTETREVSKEATAEESEETLKKLERYKKFLDDPDPAPGATGGGNELVRYLEAKIRQQTVEIEKLKEQKQELVREVFSDALNEENKGLEEKLEQKEKELARLEKKMRDMQDRRVALEEKLLEKGEQLDRALQSLHQNQAQVRAEVENEFTRKLADKDLEIQQVRAQLVQLQQQIGRQTQQLVEARSQLEEAGRRQIAADNAETTVLKEQIAQLKERVQKTVTAGANQLKALASYYEVILNHISEIIIVFDADEKIMLLNRAARSLLKIPPKAPIKANMGDYETLLPAIPAAKRAMDSGRTFHGGEMMLKPPDRPNETYRMSFCPIVFPNRPAFLLIMERVEANNPSRPVSGGGLAEQQIASLKEQLFSLKILSEIIATKPDHTQVVQESSAELQKELQKLLSALDHPETLV